MDKLEIANDLQLKVLSYFQDFIGFQNWWDSLDPKIQGDIEEGLMVGIARHLTSAIHSDGLKRCECGESLSLTCPKCQRLWES